MPQRGVRGCRGSRVAVPLKTGGYPPQGDQPEDWRAPSPETALTAGTQTDIFFNPAGLFTHTLALPYGVLEVVLRGCGAIFHGDVPEVVWYLAWCSTVSRARSLLSFPVVAPAQVSHNVYAVQG